MAQLRLAVVQLLSHFAQPRRRVRRPIGGPDGGQPAVFGGRRLDLLQLGPRLHALLGSDVRRFLRCADQRQ